MENSGITKRIYFAGSIRGGRADAELYSQIISLLQEKGQVLTEHIGDQGLTPSGEAEMTDAEIFSRDIEWLASSDVIVAEVTTASLGVGFEIARAVDIGKRVLCIYRNQPGRRLSAMIAGCRDVRVEYYSTIEELRIILDDFFGTA